MALSRAKVEERIEEDDGDPGDTVLTVDGYRTAYHDLDANCSALARDDRTPQRMSRREARNALHPPCRACIFDDENPNKGGSIEHPEERFADIIEADRERRDRGRVARARRDPGRKDRDRRDPGRLPRGRRSER